MKLVELYKKRRNAGDPEEMPGVQGPCPCWSADQLAALPPPTADASLPNACFDIDSFQALEHVETTTSADNWKVQVFSSQCIATAGGIFAETLPPLFVEGLTPEQVGACEVTIRDRALVGDAMPPIWSCWSD